MTRGVVHCVSSVSENRARSTVELDEGERMSIKAKRKKALPGVPRDRDETDGPSDGLGLQPVRYRRFLDA
jgi:hypothetical protein